MSRYEDYISRMCRTGAYTPDQVKEFALSREVEKYYQNENRQIVYNRSTYTPAGECK